MSKNAIHARLPELIKETPTGAYYRMSDGRIGYVTPEYARISVMRDGIDVHGKYYRKPNEIGDSMYQINKKYRVKDDSWYGGWRFEREKMKSLGEGYLNLVAYNERNCTPEAVAKYGRQCEQNALQHYKATANRLMQEKSDRWDRSFNDGYNKGFFEAKEEMLNQLNKLMINF